MSVQVSYTRGLNLTSLTSTMNNALLLNPIIQSVFAAPSPPNQEDKAVKESAWGGEATLLHPWGRIWEGSGWQGEID